MRTTTLPAALVALALLTACGSDDPAAQEPDRPSTPSVTGPTATTAPAPPTPPTPSATPTPSRTGLPDVTLGAALVSDLDAPWGVAVAPDGTAYVAQRDTARILRLAPDGTRTDLGEVPDVTPRGEGGLLGLAVPPAEPDVLLVYLTSGDENRVVRLPVTGDGLGQPRTVLDGIPAANNHDGGRLLVAADGTLFVGTGDAGDTENSQDRQSLGGKILRITTTGEVPPDNPFPGSPVWSLGHRNVQGLAQDSAGRLWATEFGQNTWDELNLVEPGANYGWPLVEGTDGDGDGRFVAPQAVWGTDEASPSGLAVVDDVAYVAALRGERIWQVDLAGGRAGEPRALLTGELGRLRTVLPAPDGDGLWVTTSNTDGRGDAASDDDRLLRLTLG